MGSQAGAQQVGSQQLLQQSFFLQQPNSFGIRNLGMHSFGILKQLFLPQPVSQQPLPQPWPQASHAAGAQQVGSQALPHAAGAQQEASTGAQQVGSQAVPQAAGAQQLASTGAQQVGSTPQLPQLEP